MFETTLNGIVRAALATLALLLAGAALAQAGGGALATNDARMDAWIAERQAEEHAQHQAALAAWTTYFLRLYREETGDHQTPDALAIELGRILYCERNGAECREADWRCRDGIEGVHRDRMRGAESWGVVDAALVVSAEAPFDAPHWRSTACPWSP